MKLILFFVLVFSIRANSQTVIDYSALPISTCVFTTATDVAATNGGTTTVVKHQVTVGQINSGSYITFESNSQNSVGSEFRIEYSFKQNYSYNIKIIAKSIVNSGGFPSLRLKLANTTSTINTCNGPAAIDGTLTGTVINSKSINAGTVFQEYVYNSFNSLPAAYSYLTLANIPPSGVGSSVKTIQIQKITITETAPSVGFSLSPTTVTKSCGTTLSQTFTANSTVIPTGATVSYNWDLGSANNGWLYNGTPAPQNIVTTANTLSLSAPDCAIAPANNIIATATVNGTNYNVGTVTVNATPFALIGPGTVCSSGNTSDYSISNLGCTPTISWSASPAGLVTITSPNSPTTTLTYLSEGAVTLTATYSSACGNGTVSLPIASGNPTPVGASYFNSNYGSGSAPAIVSQYARLGANRGQSGDNNAAFNYTVNDTRFTSYTWTPISQPAGTSYQVVNNGNTMWAYVTNPYTNSSVTITMQLQAFGGPCGTYTQNISSTAARVSGWGRSSVSVYPNPAKNFVDVTAATGAPSKLPSTQKIYGIRITDSYGIIRQSTEYKMGITSVRIPTNKLPAGLYLLSTYDGVNWSTKQLIIQK